MENTHTTVRQYDISEPRLIGDANETAALGADPKQKQDGRATEGTTAAKEADHMESMFDHMDSMFKDANTEWILVQRKVRGKKPKQATKGDPTVDRRDGRDATNGSKDHHTDGRDAIEEETEHRKGQRGDVRKRKKGSNKRVKFDLPN